MPGVFPHPILSLVSKDYIMTIEERFSKVELRLGRTKQRVAWLILFGAAMIVLLTGCDRAEITALNERIGVLEKELAAEHQARNQAIDAERQEIARSRQHIDDVKTQMWGEIRTRRFVLTDQNGKDRATLTVNNNEPALTLKDENGKERAILDVGKDGPALRLKDENGMGDAILTARIEGPELILADEKGAVRAVLSTNKDGAVLVMRDEKSKPRAVLAALENGPGLGLFDENGKDRAGLVMDTDGPRINLRDEQGRDIWKAPEQNDTSR
jgi:hypothetical protein